MSLKVSYSEEDLTFQLDASNQFTPTSKFDLELCRLWDQAMSAGFFRYSLEGHTRVRQLPGEYKFLVQLNTLRGVERRKPEKIEAVHTQFDPDKFNFNKVNPREVIMHMSCNGKSHPVLINVSPLDYGHVLLVPEREANLPQCLTETAISLGIHCMLLSQHRGMFVGFNSLCALASVNHLHLHSWYIDTPIYTQWAPVKKVCGCLHVSTSLPVPAIVLHLTTVQHTTRCIHAVTQYLLHSHIAHNLVMVRLLEGGAVRIYIWPRKSVTGSKNEVLVPFNVAVAELAGQIPFYVSEQFGSVTEADIVSRMKEQRLEEGKFEEIVDNICKQNQQLFTS